MSVHIMVLIWKLAHLLSINQDQAFEAGFQMKVNCV
jgi:hypothetical protein